MIVFLFSLLENLVRYFSMASTNRDFAKHQFLFSNRLFKFLSNQRPNRNSNDQLFLILAITIFVGPLNVILIRFLINRFKLDYEQFSNQEELNILKKYINQSRFYVYALIFFFDISSFLIIFPSIFNVFLYSIGKLEDNQLTLPLIDNNIDKAGMLYYSMLLYQTIGVLMITIVGSIGLSTFLIFIQHACCQCSIIKLKIRQPFERNQKSGQNTRYFSTQTEENNWISEIVNYHRISLEYSSSRYY
ncbi:PREDICTED: uncharacterized protein LOC106792391 [Polistes canadensis]|uniref:uncharacterized protein LOC106792391 n=1 Tax=Polistes canadensis TaxID=91411 RepID=UPI000718F1FB|nr:PREDICTED: uncharacterized protein LOC106792391 [Polistes canadensis]